VRIADAVVVGRTSPERVSQHLGEASELHREALEVSNGDIDSLNTDDWTEALGRAMAYLSLRNGKNRVRTENHRRRHLANYQARVAMLHSTANIGLGRLEARDLGLDDLWYDMEES